jgi:tripartite-type tricarboxylate transporter receptor subunit TctC
VRTLVSTLAFASIAFASSAQPQDWPSRQVTIVVPFTAGGTTDMFAVTTQGFIDLANGCFGDAASAFTRSGQTAARALFC